MPVDEVNRQRNAFAVAGSVAAVIDSSPTPLIDALLLPMLVHVVPPMLTHVVAYSTYSVTVAVVSVSTVAT